MIYPFNSSALSLYKWAPIADELKTLDRKIVLNSVILKWDVVKKELKEINKVLSIFSIFNQACQQHLDPPRLLYLPS